MTGRISIGLQDRAILAYVSVSEDSSLNRIRLTRQKPTFWTSSCCSCVPSLSYYSEAVVAQGRRQLPNQSQHRTSDEWSN